MRESSALEKEQYSDWKTPDQETSYDVDGQRYTYGQQVRAKKPSGKFQNDWMFGGFQQDRILLFNKFNQIQSVSREDFLSWQDKEGRIIHIGDQVTVERKNGAIENDWTLAAIKNGKAVVRKTAENGDRLEKWVDFEQFRKWQI